MKPSNFNLTKTLYALVFALGVFAMGTAQIDANSLFALPSATTAEMNGITSPYIGSLLYNTDDGFIYRYTATGWLKETTSTLTNNNDGTFTYTNEDGQDTLVSFSAADITIVDGDGNFTATNIEAALAELADDIAAGDGDSDPNNELQDLNLTGNTLSLSNPFTAGNSVDLAGYLDNTDDQNAGEVDITDTDDNFTGELQ